MVELQKQIQEERQIQELRELQVASGQNVRNTDTTMDWMYEGPAAQSQQTTEEFLLGKIYKPQDAGTKDAIVPGMFHAFFYLSYFNLSYSKRTWVAMDE